MPSVKVHRRKHQNIPVLKAGRVKVGLPLGSSGEVLDKGAYNHFGTETIPERPFLANAMRDHRAKYRRQMRDAARVIVNGQSTTAKTLTLLGIEAQGDVQREVVELRDPPNAASTIAKKGSSNPLIDTGEMRQAITYKVES